jgi:hypothetical protein
VTDSASGTVAGILTGGLHHMEAPSNTAMPYGTFFTVSAPTSSVYGGVAFSEPEIQFSVFNTGSTTALQKITALIAYYDEKKWTLSSGNNNHMERTSEPLPLPGPERDENGNPVYGFYVTYRYGLTR